MDINKPVTMPWRIYAADMLACWATGAAMVEAWPDVMRWWVWVLWLVVLLFPLAPPLASTLNLELRLPPGYLANRRHPAALRLFSHN